MNLDPETQADEVRKVKKFESGMVVNPVTIHPEQTLADALTLMAQHQISGIPVAVRRSTTSGRPGSGSSWCRRRWAAAA